MVCMGWMGSVTRARVLPRALEPRGLADYGGAMSRTFGPRLALATSLLLGGCYSGLDADDGDGGTSVGDGGTAAATTSASGPGGGTESSGATDPTADPTVDPTVDPGATSTGAEEDTGAVDDTSGDATSGPVDPSTSTTADDTTGDDTTGDTGLPPPVDVPDNAYCAPVGGWDPAWAQLELDVLELVNQVRAQGADCHGKGMFGPAGPLTMDPALRCAARKHSADMAARNFFDHTNPDGETPWDRMAKAGYGNYSNAGENIAAGSADAQGTMNQWLGSDGHCANIMNPAFQHIGVGYSTGGQYGHLWTQVFGAK